MLNKSELTGKWWQFFLDNIRAPDDVYFVKARMIRPHHDEINETFDRINKDKLVVIPINNWLSAVKKENFNLLAKRDMINTARERMDSVRNVNVTFNELELTPVRVISTFFDLNINQKNILYDFPQELQLGKLEVGEYKALSDGYWLFMDGLSTGKYEVKTTSSCATGVFALNMNHTIEIS